MRKKKGRLQIERLKIHEYIKTNRTIIVANLNFFRISNPGLSLWFIRGEIPCSKRIPILFLLVLLEKINI